MKTLLPETFYKNKGCTNEGVKQLEQQLGALLPADYTGFLLLSNGSEGTISSQYLSFWRCEDIIELNRNYSIQRYLGEKLLAFGTDGGSRCFLFDYRKNASPAVVECPLGDLDPNELIHVADSFTGFLRAF